jgi:predicted SAM-dependent methyltransferase
MSLSAGVRRLNWGCGPQPRPGWLNSDVLRGPGIELSCNILDGLPLQSESIDYIVAIHALQALSFVDIGPALAELRRVLVPGGVLRLGLPDLDRAIRAYLRGDTAYFYVPDRDAVTIGGKLCIQAAWYGSVRTPLTFDFAVELLERAGFCLVVRCAYGKTASRWPEIVELDNRERESLFVEATR